MEKLINIDPELMGGTPVFMGTRVPVSYLFEWLQSDTLAEFLENFPTVSKTQALRAMELAAKFVSDEHLLDEIAA